MREIDVKDITTAVKEMVIDANYHLSPDMKKVLDEKADTENHCSAHHFTKSYGDILKTTVFSLSLLALQGLLCFIKPE